MIKVNKKVMGTTSNLSSIIRYYAEKQNSPFIDFAEFCTWVKKYAEKHVEEQSELVKYLGDPSSTIVAELQGLEEKHLASLITGSKKTIVSVAFLSVKFLQKYTDILMDETKPFLTEYDLPKKFPNSLIEKKKASDYIISNMSNQNVKSPYLYTLEFSHEIPPLIVPASLPINTLLEVSQKKIIRILKKEDYHDFLMKKLRGSNPTKEISIKHFYAKFIDPEYTTLYDFTDGDDYYMWNQLCYLLRVEYEKDQDKTLEDINVLQAIQISEAHSSYIKQQNQLNKIREDALASLKDNLMKSPSYYSLNQILKFHDDKGRLLYGQFSEDDFKEFMQRETTEAEENKLPELVFFKVDSGTKYYIYKSKVISLIIRLCNEAHMAIEEILTEKWYKSLLEYTKLPEMNDDAKYERTLEQLVEVNSPVLYGILNASFMSSLVYEKYNDEALESFQLFSDDKLLPYSDLLMLKKEHVLAEAKVKLPFIFSLPIISWLIGLFKSKNKKKSKNETPVVVKNPFEEELESNSKKANLTRGQALAEQAILISKEFVPEGSTIDRELNFLNKQWNKMILKEASMNLTEDVNSLIRDYTRRILRTATASSFTKERIENLAETLVKTPNMQKIGEEKALKEYIQLYMIRLVSNSK